MKNIIADSEEQEVEKKVTCRSCRKNIPLQSIYCLFCGKKQISKLSNNHLIVGLILSFILITTVTVAFSFRYRYQIKSMVTGFINDERKSKRNIKVVSQSEKKKIAKIFSQNVGKSFGIDISHHNDIITWKKVKFSKEEKVEFVLIKATEGITHRDRLFDYNWQEVKKNKILRGAYHFYHPNKNSSEQAKNYIEKVKLKSGDLPPILDIEQLSTKQSIDDLRKGIQNWLKIVEKHYGVQPILYTNQSFYNNNLKDHGFDKYPLWIANFNANGKPKSDWLIWQFTEKGAVQGAKGNIDINLVNGGTEVLKKMCVK